LFFINSSPETVIVSGDKSILTARPNFGEYYIYINCVKTLYSEIEGIIRISYVREKKKNPSFIELVGYTKRKADGKFGARESLGFSDVFYRYLNEVVFKNFDLGTGQVDLSRHIVSHGGADQTQYTKNKAIQAILILDQMYFYLT
jgi:hypothetical protein